MAISPSLTGIRRIPDIYPPATSGPVPVWSHVPESLLQLPGPLLPSPL